MGFAQLRAMKEDSTAARVASLRLPDASGWSDGIRKSALARVSEAGLPHRRDEY